MQAAQSNTHQLNSDTISGDEIPGNQSPPSFSKSASANIYGQCVFLAVCNATTHMSGDSKQSKSVGDSLGKLLQDATHSVVALAALYFSYDFGQDTIIAHLTLDGIAEERVKWTLPLTRSTSLGQLCRSCAEAFCASTNNWLTAIATPASTPNACVLELSLSISHEGSDGRGWHATLALVTAPSSGGATSLHLELVGLAELGAADRPVVPGFTLAQANRLRASIRSAAAAAFGEALLGTSLEDLDVLGHEVPLR